MDKVICKNCSAENTTRSKYCKYCGYELPKVEIVSEDNNIPEKKNGKSDNKKKIAGIVAIGVITFFITFSIAFYSVQYLFPNHSIDNDMMSVASGINKTCPIMVDSETRLDNTIALPDKVFQYNYTLVNMDKSDVDTLSMKNYLEPIIINLVKSSPQMEFQRDNKWTLNYCYKDKNGLHLLMLVIKPEMYAE
ncbi:MAG: zinc ribbon domain-containing protein [Bacteroidia bacterium]|nr:zinc ribbon domain-containing protein [Bacteroidia bacterium]